jgi:hypothetical protein
MRASYARHVYSFSYANSNKLQLERHVKLAKWRTPARKYICTLFSRSSVARVWLPPRDYCMPDHSHVLLGLKPNIAPADLTSRDGSAVGFHGRKVTARFSSPIHIWIVWPTAFAIKRPITAESRSNNSILNFWGAIMFHTISVIFSRR